MSNNLQILKPDSSSLRVRHLKQFLHSSKHPHPKKLFHLKDSTYVSSTLFKSPIKNSTKGSEFNELFHILPLQESKFKEVDPFSMLQRSSNTHWEQREKSNIEKNRKNVSQITKSFLLANNNDALAFRQKDEVLLGKKKNALMTFLRFSQPEILKKALVVEKENKYEMIKRNFSEKSLIKLNKGKLFINRVQMKVEKMEKIQMKELKKDLLIIKNNPIILTKRRVLKKI